MLQDYVTLVLKILMYERKRPVYNKWNEIKIIKKIISLKIWVNFFSSKNF